MSRSCFVCAFLVLATASDGAFAQSTSPEPEPAPKSKPVSSGFSGKLGAGPAIHGIHGHEVWGARLQMALGAQIRDIGAIHGDLSYGIGATELGLKTQTYSFAVTWEFIVGPARLGLGPEFTLLWMDRYTTDFSTMDSSGTGFTTFIGFDVVQSDHVNLNLALHGRYAWLANDLGYGGAGLTLGGRVKTP